MKIALEKSSRAKKVGVLRMTAKIKYQSEQWVESNTAKRKKSRFQKSRAKDNSNSLFGYQSILIIGLFINNSYHKILQ